MTVRNLPARFGLAVLAGLLALFALVGVTQTPSAQAAGATLNHPSVQCSSSNATASFKWTQVTGATAQYLDLSVQDGNFRPGTFAGTPVTGDGASWPGLEPGAIYWWRINSNTNAGWQTSDVKTFVPCGNPQALTVNATCADANNANVDFFWVPVAGATSDQYIDVSQDQDFRAGRFEGRGPIASGASSYRWANLKPNTMWYYRINQRMTDGTWKASPVKTASFRCGAAGTAIAASQNIAPDIYGSNDRLLIPGVKTDQRCGASVNAPVNVRDVALDGHLGDPATDCDVVRYDFKLFPGYGGYPGEGGATILAGHLDYNLRNEGGSGSVVGVAQHWKSLREGDTVQYQRGDGKVLTYRVSWVSSVPLGSNFDYSTLARQSTQESLALITCGGVWNAAAREYEERTVVYALRVN